MYRLQQPILIFFAEVLLSKLSFPHLTTSMMFSETLYYYIYNEYGKYTDPGFAGGWNCKWVGLTNMWPTTAEHHRKIRDMLPICLKSDKRQERKSQWKNKPRDWVGLIGANGDLSPNTQSLWIRTMYIRQYWILLHKRNTLQSWNNRKLSNSTIEHCDLKLFW